MKFIATLHRCRVNFTCKYEVECNLKGFVFSKPIKARNSKKVTTAKFINSLTGVWFFLKQY